MIHPSKEEFTAWRDHPVTRWVMEACRKAAEDNKRHWVEAAWESGTANQAHLIENRTRADAYLALAETQYDGWKGTHDADQPG